jgi:uncharacterized protein YjlB
MSAELYKKPDFPKIFFLEEDEEMPNNPHLPVLLYRGFIESEPDVGAGKFEDIFHQEGWGGTWRNGIFTYHHFHPDAHEALGIACGKATVQLGGENGQTYDVSAGDLLVLPAGTGHKKLNSSDDFLVVGAYPPGQENFTTCRHKDERAFAADEIKALGMPDTGGFIAVWSTERR